MSNTTSFEEGFYVYGLDLLEPFASFAFCYNPLLLVLIYEKSVLDATCILESKMSRDKSFFEETAVVGMLRAVWGDFELLDFTLVFDGRLF